MSSSSVRLSDENKSFLKRCSSNMIKVGTISEPKSFAKVLDVIEKYFKENNNSYVDMCIIGGKK